MALNKIIIQGRIVRDIELRRTASGVSVVSLTLAVDRDFKSKDGEKETDFIDVVAYRNTAEFLSKYFGKGRMAIVDGRLQIREWEKDGVKRRTAEVVADNVYFGDSRPSEGSNAPTYAAPVQSQEFAEIGEEDGELPF
jgi:single-strand DNA-binding protein